MSLEQWCRSRRREDVLPVLTDRGLTAAPVRTWPEVREARHDGGRLSQDVPHPYAARHEVFLPPWCFDGRLPAAPRRAPFLAEHTDEVLSQLTSLRSERLTPLKAGGGIVQRVPLATDIADDAKTSPISEPLAEAGNGPFPL